MNYFSFLFYCLVQISAVFADPETADLAKGHCENWFVSQGEEIENIFFEYVASGGQSDIYKCESFRYHSQKLYRGELFRLYHLVIG